MTTDIAIRFELRIAVAGVQSPSLVLQNFCSRIWSHFYILIRYLSWQKEKHNLEYEKSLLFPNLAIKIWIPQMVVRGMISGTNMISQSFAHPGKI